MLIGAMLPIDGICGVVAEKVPKTGRKVTKIQCMSWEEETSVPKMGNC